MEIIAIVLKVILHSVLGFYIVSLFKNNKKYFFMNGISIPSFGLFSLFSIFIKTDNIILLFLIGILGAYTVRIISNLIYKNTFFNNNILIFGLLNIMNYYFFNKIFDYIIGISSKTTLTYLLYISLPLFLIDLSLSIRKRT